MIEGRRFAVSNATGAGLPDMLRDRHSLVEEDPPDQSGPTQHHHHVHQLDVVPATMLPMPLEIVEGCGSDRVSLNCRHRHPLRLLTLESSADSPVWAAAASHPPEVYQTFLIGNIQTFREQSGPLGANDYCPNNSH